MQVRSPACRTLFCRQRRSPSDAMVGPAKPFASYPPTGCGPAADLGGASRFRDRPRQAGRRQRERDGALHRKFRPALRTRMSPPRRRPSQPGGAQGRAPDHRPYGTRAKLDELAAKSPTLEHRPALAAAGPVDPVRCPRQGHLRMTAPRRPSHAVILAIRGTRPGCRAGTWPTKRATTLPKLGPVGMDGKHSASSTSTGM